MRLVLGLMAAIALTACAGEVAGVDCSSTTDCPSGSECRDGICVQVACTPACDAFEECQASLCAPAFLAPAIESPANGAQVIGGLEVVARLDRAVADGTSEPPSRLKLVAAPTNGNPIEAFLERASEALRYQKAVALPSGTYSIKAVFTEVGLESAPVSVAVAECAQPCGSFEECIQSQCRPVFDSLSLSAPEATNGPVAVTARLHRALASSLKSPPEDLSLKVSPAPGTSVCKLTRVEGTDDYEGTLVIADGYYDLVATSAELALSSEPATVLVDTTAPVFELAVLPPPARHQGPGLTTSDPESPNAYRRDEEAVVRISCSESGSGVSAESLSLRVAGDPGGELTVVPAAAETCAGNVCCFEARVPLFDSALQMNAFRTAFGMELSGSDQLGNAASASGEIPVTRFKWSLDAGNGAIATTPAIGRNGFVYFGGSNSPGHAFAASPEGILTDLLTTSGPVSQSMVVSIEGQQDTLFVAGTSGPGSSVPCGDNPVGAVWVINGADTAAPTTECVCSGGDSAAGHLALTKTSMDAESPTDTAICAFNRSSGAYLIASRPHAATNKCVVGSLGTSAVDNLSGVVIRNGQAVIADAAGTVRALGLTPIVLTQVWSTSLEELASSFVWLPNGDLIFSANAGPIGRSTRLSANGEFLAASAPVAALGPPIVASGAPGKILTSDSTGKVFAADVAFSNGAQLPVLSASGGGDKAAMALGADRALYSTASGLLTTFGEEGSVLWRGSFSGLGASSLALDCSRSPDGIAIAKPGVLYAGASSGLLYAIITDSHGLDYDSPWPKFNRDAQNTSDADRAFPVGHPLRCP